MQVTHKSIPLLEWLAQEGHPAIENQTKIKLESDAAYQFGSNHPSSMENGHKRMIIIDLGNNVVLGSIRPCQNIQPMLLWKIHIKDDDVYICVCVSMHI